MSKIARLSTDNKTIDARKYFQVCVITRTKDRPLLLKRAASSVAAQKFSNYCWVVVNDGGDESSVKDIIENSGIDKSRVKLISNPHSFGMEAASNTGICAVASEYIIVHDDDDSWDPEFLDRTVAFLEGVEGKLYDGVITYSTYVSELIRDDEVIRLSDKPYQGGLAGVDLDVIVERNLFPPISFLFRRTVYDKVGGYDETLPVLGDWLFNMEFLLHANIGVLPQFLAFYHHRDRSDLTAPEYRNTVVDQLSLHQKYTSIVRNRFLRDHMSQSVISLRMALQAETSGAVGEASIERRAAGALPAVQALARGDGDLAWTIGAVNAALADVRRHSFFKHRKLTPVPPNGTWSLVLPLVRKLDVVIPQPYDFDENGYLRDNPDVAAEVSRGAQKSGFMHYLLHGLHEGRARTSGEYLQSHSVASVYADGVRVSRVRPVFDSPLMLRTSHQADGFERVLHVAHHEWHGIRQATAYSPGHKLLIPAHEPIHDDEKRVIAETIGRMGIERICIQGYSENSDALLLYLRAVLGPSVKFFMVSHVTTAQFDHHFEMVVISRLLNRLKFGVLDGIASVKPNFGKAIEGFWGGTIINYAPKMAMPRGRRSPQVEVYAPLDIGWRKNLFTNVMAASLASNVDTVKTANFPNGLENLHDLHKLRLVGYLRGRDLLDEMARSSLTLIATLAECQPMTQLESFAAGTPALTGPLELAEFAKDPLVELCTTYHLDNPALLAKDIENVVDAVRRDPQAMEQMIVAHLEHRHAIATQNYADFLEL
ncbi:MAG TPA: glycosyltransferase [Sphingobium sp.]|uniref:glycosyltransferase n=1 Tax=Sphingobium sp. TaxID=1912891 RepID=UPI002ED24B04